MAALPKTESKTDPKPEVASGAEPGAGETGGPAKGRGKLMMIAGIAVAVLGIGGGAAFYLLGATPAEAPAEETAPAPAHKTAIYLNLRPDFIVNSTAVGQRRYLQTNVVVMARDQLVIDAVNTHAPVIRSAIVNLLADEDFMVLQTDEGKRALREKMRAAIDSTLQKEAHLDGVEAVLFNSFVMQ
jgi:flagellar FliL protein